MTLFDQSDLPAGHTDTLYSGGEDANMANLSTLYPSDEDCGDEGGDRGRDEPLDPRGPTDPASVHRAAPARPAQTLWPIDSALRRERLRERMFGTRLGAVKLGRFTLLERIGAGGMGEVYAAYDEQLDRKVAIKLVRDSHRAASGMHARLLREAKTLAKLSHPNIVQVYDAGEYGDRVFIAMEFIRGQTLREWVTKVSRSRPGADRVREILRVFTAAGRGLQAAHDAGVIHRDFKPANVLVGGDGRPRVVDFGLARTFVPTPSEVSNAGVAANEGGIAAVPAGDSRRDSDACGPIEGTVGYMAPEQMRGRRGNARSDQFSFCVALYWALYGERPFPGNTLASVREAVDGGAPLEPPRGKGVPASVRAALMRGLAVDPNLRFDDMDELLTALAAGERRQRRRWLIAAAAALTLTSGGAVYGVAQLTADRPYPCADAAAPVASLWTAERRDALASALARTGVPYAKATWRGAAAGLDDYADQWAHSSRDACEATYVHRTQSAALLDRRAACLDDGRRQLDALLTALADADAAAVERTVSAVAALPDPAACDNLEAVLNSAAPPAPEIADQVRHIRDRLAQAHTQRALGRYREALAVAREASAAAAATGYDPVRAEALFAVGWVMVLHGTTEQIREGELHLHQASDLAEGARHDVLVPAIWRTMAVASYRNHATSERGRLWLGRALAGLRRIGDPTADKADALRIQGLMHYKDKDYAAAAASQRDALALLPDRAGPLVRSRHLHGLANTLRAQGKLDEARPLYERALAELSAVVGDQHPLVADLRFDLANWLLDSGAPEDAEPLMEAALNAYRTAVGPTHQRIGQIHLALAEIARNRGALDRAYAHVRRAAEIYDSAFEPEHFEHSAVQLRLGAIAFRMGRLSEAEAAYRRALAIQQRHLGADDLDVGFTRANLAETYVQMGRHDDALAELRAAEAIFVRHPDIPVLAPFVGSQRGLALLGKGQIADAVRVLEPAAAAFRTLPGNAVERADCYWALARALATRDAVRANDLAREALAIYETHGPEARAAGQAVRAFLAERPANRGADVPTAGGANSKTDRETDDHLVQVGGHAAP